MDCIRIVTLIYIRFAIFNVWKEHEEEEPIKPLMSGKIAFAAVNMNTSVTVIEIMKPKLQVF